MWHFKELRRVRNCCPFVALLFTCILVFIFSSSLSNKVHPWISRVSRIWSPVRPTPPVLHRPKLARSRPPNWMNRSSNIEAKPTGWLVDTPSCRIPDFDAYNPSMSLYIRDPIPNFIVCNHSLPITVTDRQYVRLNTTLAKSLNIQRCLYQQV